ncbi:hypothetical protein K4F52_003510 [Lecanicillium sp. MT-2017a]|nr:hypothetical protein K4F52_003510 [Lecanicillium sp. MT-2017a]
MTTVTATGSGEMAKPGGLVRSKSKKWAFLGRSKSKRLNNATGSEGQALSSASGTHTTANTNTTANASQAKSTSPSTVPDRQAPQGRRRDKPAVGRSTTHTGVSPRFAIQNAVDSAGSTSVASPRLDVEIPDIKLERYSVMFKGLIQNQQSSTLLARRQATVSRLRAIEDEVRREKYYENLHRARRVTSPTGMTPTEPQTTPSIVPLRLRSNTYPVTRENTPENVQAEPIPPAESAIASPSSARDGEQRPRLLSKFHKSSSESLQSAYNKNIRPSREYLPSDRNSAERSTPTIPEAPEEPEPKKELKTTDIPKRSTSLNKAAQRTRREKELEDAALEDAVEVSIARQISISRQQRKLLKPFHERASSKSGTTAADATGGQAEASDGNKRLAATKKSTPTFIHPNRDPDSPQHIYRRSERVILEGA